MNKQRFLDLLNLYLDHQITAAEAAELEAAVLRHPEYRRIYRQYCQMDRACALLGAALAEQTAKQGEREPAQIIPFSRGLASSASGWRGVWVVAGAAVAASFALIVVLRMPGDGSALETTTTQSPLAGVQTVGGGPAITVASNYASGLVGLGGAGSAAVVPVAYQPLAVSPVLSVGLAPGRELWRDPETTAAVQPEMEWMQRVEFMPVAPLSAEDRLFESLPVMQDQPRPTLRRGVQGKVEFTAFQFQR